MSRVSSIEAARMQSMRKVQGKNAQIASLPAPIGGWNARDAISSMDIKDAVILTNWWPTTGDVMIRKGYTKWATGLPGQVETLMPYNPATGSEKLFAASTTKIYDVSTAGAVGGAVVSGLTTDRLSYTNFATAAGPYLGFVNGVDGYYIYNGSSWTSITSGSSPISITGVDPTTLSFITSYAQRVWFIQKTSLNAYYLPVASVGGAAAVFPMQQIFRRGGYLVSIGIWTIDGGYGMQDYMAFVTSEGEVAIYGGTDPTQSSNFYLVGVYQLGTPMGDRCFLKFGSDLLYMGKDGLGPLSKLMSSTRVNTSMELTYKIQGAISQSASLYANNFGWSMVLFPLENMLILNVPVSTGANQQQYAMNTITGSWCNFTGWSANCWERFNDFIYFGSNGYVGKAWSTFSDAGNNITATALQAFTNFGSGLRKRFTMLRPILWTDGVPSITANVAVDYDKTTPQFAIDFSPVKYGVWDASAWDQSNWAGDLDVQRAWQGVTGFGFAGAAAIQAQINGMETHWSASDMVYELGQNAI